MEWLKIIVSRMFGFVMAVLPGAAVLLVIGIHHPDWAARVWNTEFLGYRTRVSLVLACAFIAGWTVTVAFNVLFGGIDGAIWGALSKWLSGAEPEVKPWQNANWRALLISYLGKAAPENVPFIYDSTLQLQVETADQYPEPGRSQMLAEFRRNKTLADLNDFEWKGWWSHLHHDLTFRLDPIGRITNSLLQHFQTASLVILCSLPSTPLLRQWWLVSACIFWMSTRFLQTAHYLTRTRDPWSSFVSQLGFLRERLDRQPNPDEESEL